MYEIYASEAGADNEYVCIDLLRSSIYNFFLADMFCTMVFTEDFGLL